MEKCGFVNVKVEDGSELYQQYCRKEIEIAEKNRANPNSVIKKKDFIINLYFFLCWFLEINSSRTRRMYSTMEIEIFIN